MNDTLGETYNYLAEILGDKAMSCVVSAFGYNLDTVNAMLYALTAYHDLDQMKECEK